MSKKILLVFLAGLLVFSAAFSAGGYPEKIYFGVKMQEEIAVRDVAEGMSDIFMNRVPGPIFAGLDQRTLDRLIVYTVPSGSNALLLNPYPNQAPYQGIVDGKAVFNPFAIQEVRFAMNFLIDRQFIVDEILAGAGMPKMTQATAGQPNAWRVELVAQKYGLTPEGDTQKGKQMITEAMQKAAQLPENRGRLVRGASYWEFDGAPVEIKFNVRQDDPTMRVRVGNYVAGMLEEIGIKVEILPYERARSSGLTYGTDPAELQWHIYTEGWGGGSTYVYWQTPTQQYNSPRGSFYPGRLNAAFWNMENEEADKLAEKYYDGKILTEEEFWEAIVRGTEIGFEDSIRIWLVSTYDFFIQNKERLPERLPVGLGHGLDEYTLGAADPEDGILRALQYSATGSLFMFAWNPVGTQGFSDVWASDVSQMVWARAVRYNPFGQAVPTHVEILNTDNDSYRDADGNIQGNLPVPSNAVKYNPYTQKFEEVGNDVKSMTTTTFEYIWPNWHHGRSLDMNDILYKMAFTADWSYKTSEEDKKFDNAYSAHWKPSYENVQVGFVIEDEKTITTYFNYNAPFDETLQAVGWTPEWRLLGSNRGGIGLPWEVNEALALMVIEPNKSGKIWSFTDSPGVEEIDLKVEACTADIKVKLQEMIERRYVPHMFKGIISENEAVRRYQMAVDFIDKYGHAVIGHGNYMLTTLDTVNNFIELSVFEDYPHDKTYWASHYALTRLRIDNTRVPAFSTVGLDIEIDVYASLVDFPTEKARIADSGIVQVVLVTDEGENWYDATLVKPGHFKVVIPEKDTYHLDTGVYTLIVTATNDGFTSSETYFLDFY